MPGSRILRGQAYFQAWRRLAGAGR